MSDGKEVKRWGLWRRFKEDSLMVVHGEYDMSQLGPCDTAVKVMPVADHDRIVAELRADVAALSQTLVDIATIDADLVSMSTKITHQEATIDELRAEVAALKLHKAQYEADCKRIEYFDDLHEKIATQAREAEVLKAVIEIATRTMATVLELEHCGQTSCPRPMRALCSNESHKVLRSALREIAAIEKEGAKDNE